jgi:uncharacterized membrane protein YdcZ (DUF606 family)
MEHTVLLEDEPELIERAEYLLEPDEPDIETPLCRICFEEDTLDENSGMFSPCRCKGSQKWVHRECLNTWRVSSEHREAYYGCMTCKYKYHVSEANTDENEWGCIRYLSERAGVLFLMNVFIVLMTTWIIIKLDPNHVIAEYFWSDLFTIHNWYDWLMGQRDVIYLLISTSIYSSIILGMFIGNLVSMKNRKLYIKYMLGHNYLCAMIRILLVISTPFLGIMINFIVGILTLSIIMSALLSMHYTYMNRLYMANEVTILPYDPIDDNNDRVGIV